MAKASSEPIPQLHRLETEAKFDTLSSAPEITESSKMAMAGIEITLKCKQPKSTAFTHEQSHSLKQTSTSSNEDVVSIDSKRLGDQIDMKARDESLRNKFSTETVPSFN